MTNPKPEPAHPGLETLYRWGWRTCEIAAYVNVVPVTVRTWRLGTRVPNEQHQKEIEEMVQWRLRPVPTTKFYGKK